MHAQNPIRTLAAVFVILILAGSPGCAAGVWDLGIDFDAAKANLSGVLCWTLEKHPKDFFASKERQLYAMNLATGEIRVYRADGSLIQGDGSNRGVLLAREEAGTLVILRQDGTGAGETMLSCASPLSGDYPIGLRAYMGGYLYYLSSEDDGKTYALYRSDLKGEPYRYHAPSQLPKWCNFAISPGGQVAWAVTAEDGTTNGVAIESPNADVRLAVSVDRLPGYEGINGSLLCWLDEQTLLFAAYREIEGDVQYTVMALDTQSGSTNAYPDQGGNEIGVPYYVAGGSSVVLDGTGRYLAYMADAVGAITQPFNVPVVLDLKTGESHLLYETAHTDEYDEYSTDHAQLSWYSAD